MNPTNGSGRPEPHIPEILQSCERSLLKDGRIMLHLDTIQPTTLCHSPLATYPDPRFDDMDAHEERVRTGRAMYDAEDVERWCS